MPGDKAMLFLADAADLVRTGPEGAGTVIAMVTSPAAAAALAGELVEQGVDTIELCGATGFTWVPEVEAAVKGRARVGTVVFGFESLLDVARYKQRATDGESLTALFIHVREGADPEVDRLELQEGPSRSLFVAVPRAEDGAAVAAALADRIDLIELYGGFRPEHAAAVIRAVDERVPVGVAVHATVPHPDGA
ncbi:DUF6506 family protein [Streptomyces sp. NPDC051018]|uniref:DUF6506 family protein n=1 Tax=Streptomyces sp. NPDC051018 TaxID=3365639 RepID=UPI0037A59504